MMKPFHWIVFLLLSGSAPGQFGDTSLSFGGDDDFKQATTASLISEVKSVKPGSTFDVALRLKMDEHWHTYWTHGGDSDTPTEVVWDLPEGFSAGPIQWPLPKRFVTGPAEFRMVGFGYEDEVHLLVSITAPADITGEVTLKGKVSWLECDPETCVPGEQAVSLALPVGDGAVDEVASKVFAATRALFPVSDADWKVYAYPAGKRVAVDIVPPAGVRLDGAVFHPITRNLIDLITPGEWSQTNGVSRLLYKVHEYNEGMPGSLEGVLVGVDGSPLTGSIKALQVEVKTFGETPPEGIGAPVAAAEGPTDGPANFWIAALFMFFGGVILNLMPCVFPVLSLKVLGFVQHANATHTKPWHHGLMFAAGILVSFWVLAGIFIAFKSSVGWGFQLQNPGFVLFMALLFLLISLNLFGVFEFGSSLTGVGGELQNKSGFSGSFFSGVLATLVATPCTAPFMGSAIPFALSLPAVLALLLFTMLGLGMAAPYVILSSVPALIKRMPRPGNWMITFKIILGFVMFGAVIWLVWVFEGLRHSNGMLRLMIVMLLIAFTLYLYGKWSHGFPPLAKRLVYAVLPVVTIVAGSWWALQVPLKWEAWSPAVVQAALDDGKPVFIDYTARWCVTCQINKKTTLRTDKVMQAFEDHDVVVLSADWTDKNQQILRALNDVNRNGVPAYVLHKNLTDKPVLLPNVLTPDIVIGALKDLKGEDKSVAKAP